MPPGEKSGKSEASKEAIAREKERRWREAGNKPNRPSTSSQDK